MGIEVGLAIASLAVGVIGGGLAAGDRKKSAGAQRKRNKIQVAQTTITANEDRRRRVREDRIRRATLRQKAENLGIGGSSVEAGALSSLETNFNTLQAQQLSVTKGNEGINKWNQKAVNFENKARETLAWTEVFQNGISVFGQD